MERQLITQRVREGVKVAQSKGIKHMLWSCTASKQIADIIIALNSVFNTIIHLLCDHKWTVSILTEASLKKKDNILLAKSVDLVKVEGMERRDQHG